MWYRGQQKSSLCCGLNVPEIVLQFECRCGILSESLSIVGERMLTQKTQKLLHWLQQEKKIEHDYKTKGWRIGTELFTEKAIWNIVNTSAPTSMRKSGHVFSTLAVWSRQARKEFRTKLMEDIIENWAPPSPQAGEEMWDRWIAAVCKEGRDMSKLVMQHFCWQVQRKLLSMPVTDHICPVWYGATQGGKSTEMLQFLGPVDALMQARTVAYAVDERNFPEYQEYFIIYMDELGGAKKADRETLKMLITADTLNAHVFHSQESCTIKQNATFIGTSNKSVQEVISDQTSGRRFWEVRCRLPLDWDYLNSKDCDRRLLWGHINPLDASPLERNPELKRQIHTLQNDKIRTKNSVEIWVEDREIRCGNQFVTSLALYNAYKEFCAIGKYYTVNQRRFTKILREITDLEEHRRNSARGWFVNSKF